MTDQLPSLESVRAPDGFNADDLKSILPAGMLSTSETLQETTEAQDTASEYHGASEPSAQNDTNINDTAFILAFLGWDSVGGAPNLAGCAACFRRLGLWMYVPKNGEDISTHDPLDAANEHMDYCPWINSRAQSGTGNPSDNSEGLHSGWELLAQAFKVKHLRQAKASTPVGSRAGSEAPSTDNVFLDEPNDDVKKAKDREWWTKIRRMKQMLNVKTPKRKPSTSQ